MKNVLFFFVAALFSAHIVTAQQIVDPEPSNTIKGLKERVTCIKVSPKGDRVLVGFGEFAALYDIDSGKKVAVFEHVMNSISAIYDVGFNDDGSLVYTIDLKGKVRYWEAENGKLRMLGPTLAFSPDPREVIKLGLIKSNKANNYYYLQNEVELPGKSIAVKSIAGASIQFLDKDSKVVQEIKFVENKDRFHMPPVVVSPDGQWLITGTDRGEIRFYSLN